MELNKQALQKMDRLSLWGLATHTGELLRNREQVFLAAKVYAERFVKMDAGRRAYYAPYWEAVINLVDDQGRVPSLEAVGSVASFIALMLWE